MNTYWYSERIKIWGIMLELIIYLIKNGHAKGMNEAYAMIMRLDEKAKHPKRRHNE